jgi:hypothetical protein
MVGRLVGREDQAHRFCFQRRAPRTPAPARRFAGQFSQSPAVPALTSSQEFDLEGHPLLFRTIGAADGALATIVYVPDRQAICSGDIVYNNIHM